MLGTIRVGHIHDAEALTGCTVFLPPPGTIGACEVRGGWPGTRDTAMLRPTFTADGPHAILLTGGSAFGLDAAGGVSSYLEENGIGVRTTAGRVPIVSAAVIYDLNIGSSTVRPDAKMAYDACLRAHTDEFRQGSIGVGIGARVGNVRGARYSTRGGFGTYRFQADGLRVEVALVVNSYGDVVDNAGRIMAGVRNDDNEYVGAEKLLCVSSGLTSTCEDANTTLVVIATNAKLDSGAASRVAIQGHNGIARATRPSHTRYDGDTVFVLATGEVEGPQDAVEVLAAMGTAEAIRSAVMHATPAAGIPCAHDILGNA